MSTFLDPEDCVRYYASKPRRRRYMADPIRDPDLEGLLAADHSDPVTQWAYADLLEERGLPGHEFVRAGRYIYNGTGPEGYGDGYASLADFQEAVGRSTRGLEDWEPFEATDHIEGGEAIIDSLSGNVIAFQDDGLLFWTNYNGEWSELTPSNMEDVLRQTRMSPAERRRVRSSMSLFWQGLSFRGDDPV